MTSTSSLTFDLTDEQRALRDTIREFAEGEIAPHAAVLGGDRAAYNRSC